jgi:predicted dinucleotide-binding enzyme
MGAALGRIWAQAGHRVVFCFGRERRQLEEVARAAGPAARAASPAEAVAAAGVVVLAVPWGAVDEALVQAGPLDGKIVLSIVNPLKPDLSGLAIGTTTSAAEEIAARAPGARVVEAIPPFAEVLASPSRRFGGEQPAVFYCGDDAAAKAAAVDLLSDLDVAPVDVGPLRNARYVEPAGFLLMQIQCAPTAHGQYGLRLLTREA